MWRTYRALYEQEDALADLHLLLDGNEALPATVHSALAILDRTSAHALRSLVECADHQEEVWKPSERSAQVAQQVFQIPELCEQILCELTSFQDVHCASRMNRATFAIACDSPAVQVALGLAPGKGKHWRALFPSGRYQGFKCDMVSLSSWSSRSKLEAPETPAIEAGFGDCYSYYTELPRIGTAYLNMPICWPVLRKMQPVASCCGTWDERQRPQTWRVCGFNLQDPPPPPSPKAINPLVRPKGITVGDIYDATARIREEHRLCPYASSGSLDKEGLVHPTVEFKGTLRLAADDPMLAARRQALADLVKDESRRYHPRCEAEDCEPDLRESYTEAKMDALRAQRKIPTLAEYAAGESRKAYAADQARKNARIDGFGTTAEAPEDGTLKMVETACPQTQINDVEDESDRGDERLKPPVKCTEEVEDEEVEAEGVDMEDDVAFASTLASLRGCRRNAFY
ncbi:hypothetical protein LTR17_001785 [Elasticomyces elasticus]|nr:hypothetical protein LTR17_001785 [Elasticomyces elasticus]